MNESLSALGIRDIHLPDSVSWWPLASGWWLLLALGLFFIVLAYQKVKKRKALLAFKSDSETVLSKSRKLLNNIEQGADNKKIIKEISVLLRRTSISLYGQENIAGLTGKKWLLFLDETGETDQFSLGKGRVLIDQPYTEYTDYDRDELVAITREWLAAQVQQGRQLRYSRV